MLKTRERPLWHPKLYRIISGKSNKTNGQALLKLAKYHKHIQLLKTQKKSLREKNLLKPKSKPRKMPKIYKTQSMPKMILIKKLMRHRKWPMSQTLRMQTITPTKTLLLLTKAKKTRPSKTKICKRTI